MCTTSDTERPGGPRPPWNERTQGSGAPKLAPRGPALKHRARRSEKSQAGQGSAGTPGTLRTQACGAQVKQPSSEPARGHLPSSARRSPHLDAQQPPGPPYAHAAAGGGVDQRGACAGTAGRPLCAGAGARTAVTARYPGVPGWVLVGESCAIAFPQSESAAQHAPEGEAARVGGGTCLHAPASLTWPGWASAGRWSPAPGAVQRARPCGLAAASRKRVPGQRLHERRWPRRSQGAPPLSASWSRTFF